MSRRVALLVVCFGASWLLALGPSSGQAGALRAKPVASLHTAGFHQLEGSRTNVRLDGSRLVLDADPAFVRDGQAFGFFVSDVRALDQPFDVVTAHLEIAAEGGEVQLAARSSPDGVSWSPWHIIPQPGNPVTVPPGRFFQYRVELGAAAGESAAMSSVGFDLASSGAPLISAASSHPTVRVFATREGLVGRKTANGHTIEERDRFAALPSKLVLNPRGKKDYQVKISYRGRSATVPVWDVGPWNTRDNYWDDRRDLFTDLPRFLPQAYAAWRNDYNGGRDQFKRWVTIPASIDIADGTFIDDLGMGNSDWVDVTFLWVDAASPSKGETPTVAGLKPEPKTEVLAADGRTWYFAEGNTKEPFETRFLLHNPGESKAKATLHFMGADGSVKREQVTIDANDRVTVLANEVIPKAEFSTRVEANQPIFVARSMSFGSDGHSAGGSTKPTTTWYLADGSTEPPFDSWLLLHNPGESRTNVAVTFMKDSGENQVVNLVLQAESRRSVHLNEVVPNAGFSTKVTADHPIVVERAVYLARGGGHSTAAAHTTSKSWHIAEGSTRETFDTWLLIQNPGRTAARVTITYLREDDEPIEQKLTVGATSRSAVNARNVLAGERFGARIDSDQQIVVERAMYFGGAADGSGTGAHSSVAAPELARSWGIAEGSTAARSSQQLIVANPNDSTARLRAELTKRGGDKTVREYDVGPMRRLTIDVDDVLPETDVWAKVSADLPVVVERSTYSRDGSGGTNALGHPR